MASRDGTVVHDAYRARLFFVPAGKGGSKLRAWLRAQGLTSEAPLPPVAPRVAQVFIVRAGQAPDAAFKTTPEARFTCSACGTSCRTINLGPLFPADVDRLLALDWNSSGHDPARFFVDRDGNPVDDERVAARRDLYLRRESDGCQFLRADNLCGVHARFGMEAKPYMCRAFPVQFRASPAGIVVGTRLGECMRAEAGLQGPEIAQDLQAIRALWNECPLVSLLPPLVWLVEGALVTWEEYESLERALLEAAPEGSGARHGAGLALLLRAVDAVARRAGLPLPEPCSTGDLMTLRDQVLEEDPPPGPLPMARVAATGLDDAALRLEERMARLRLFSKDAFQHSTVLAGISHLAVSAWLSRERAMALAAGEGAPLARPGHLNEAVKELTAGPLRKRIGEMGLDVVAVASAIAWT